MNKPMLILLALVFGWALASCSATPSAIPTSTPPPAGLPPVPPVSEILDFSFANERTGWLLAESCESAGGCTPTLLSTADGGQTWQLQGVPPQEALQGNEAGADDRPQLRFADPQTGWLVGAETWVTQDGGVTWASEALDGPVVALEAVGGEAWALTGDCAAPNECSYTLFLWDSASRAWSAAPAQPPIARQISQFIHATAEDAAILHEPGAIADPQADPLLLTHDGGRNWKGVSTPCSSETVPAGASTHIGSPDGHRLWIICSGGQGMKSFYFSNDGGLTWSPEAPFSAAGSITDMEIISVRRGFLGMQNGPLMGTFDGGLAWGPVVALEESSVPEYTWQIEFSNTLFGWAAAGDRFFRTFDGGDHWDPIELP